MVIRIACLGATAGLALLLSGCSLFHHNSRMADGRAARAAREIPYDGTFEFVFGRQALLTGQYGLAISSLRKAEYYPRYRGESANGLGIAYAAIGRDDVALRFFQKAVNADPDQARFRANLDRHEIRMARAATLERDWMKPAPAPALASASPEMRIAVRSDGSAALVADGGNASSMVRISSREVLIVQPAGPAARQQRVLALTATPPGGAR